MNFFKNDKKTVHKNNSISCHTKKAHAFSWLFGNGAVYYNFLTGLIFLGREKYYRSLAFEEIKKSSPDKLLEIGVGTGANIPYWPDTAFCIGIDNSSSMLRFALNKNVFSRRKKSQLCLADANSLPFPNNTFDASFFFLFCSQKLKIGQIFQETNRVLKKPATIVIVDYLPSKSALGYLFERFFDSFLAPFQLTLRNDILTEIDKMGWKVVHRINCSRSFPQISILTITLN